MGYGGSLEAGVPSGLPPRRPASANPLPYQPRASLIPLPLASLVSLTANQMFLGLPARDVDGHSAVLGPYGRLLCTSGAYDLDGYRRPLLAL
jgi:hypothetical protein